MAFIPPPGCQPIYNPTLPFSSPIYGNLRVGMSIYLHGKIHHHHSSFHVNLQCGSFSGCDIALHFNPRIQLWDKVVFNSFQGGYWQSEEKAHLPFRKGEEFEMVIIVNPEGYQVNVNREQLYFFQHRIPFEQVDTLEIGGDVIIHTLNIIGGGWSGGMQPAIPSYPGQPGYQGQMMNVTSFSGQPAYQGGMPGYQGENLMIMSSPAISNPGVPYRNIIPGGLSPKRTIIIRGMVLPGAGRFHINFKVSYTGDIVFHLSACLREYIVIRNSFLGGCWGQEERELEFNPFQLGQYFDMSIRSGHRRFKVYVNGQHLCSFHHRFHEFQQVDTLEVEGDVQISYVQF
ncbi:galectin-4-like [Erpetoichthys calabaricus]|uniref:galectin-4-like n=1 Tax=Erpetoichthys calabaricus TaxID=27687 RepID=UPI00223478B6|nr:galectin-4-like [Erpetoichthys calabaricus]